MTKKKSPNVPEQYRGFALQPTRMAFLLLKGSPGDLVSLELFEDVGVQQKDGTTLASQTKSARRTNPVSDSSPALWKTLANWSRAVRDGSLDPSKTTFELYINRRVSGKMVSVLCNAKTKADVKAAVEIIREKFWGNAPKFSKKSKIAASLKEHIEEILGVGADAFQCVLPRFQLNFAIKTPALDLHEVVAGWPTVFDHVIVDLVCHLHGWLKEKIDLQLALGKSPIVSRDECMKELRAFYGRIVPSGTLPDLASKPSLAEILALLPFQFVKQLEIIDSEKETIQHAMHCYFKAASVRTRWSQELLIHEDSFKDFEQVLINAYRNYKTDVFSDPLRSDPALRGRLLHGKCDQHRCRLEDKEVPHYFIPGCFHSLADKRQIGWHPNFDVLLGATTT
jgi:hypothetical protein